MAEDGEGRLQRWSRRKAEARVASTDDAGVAGGLRDVDGQEPLAALAVDGTSAGEVMDPAGMPPDGLADPEGLADSEGLADEEAIPEDLPDIESLDKDSDFSVFMREGVPQKLRNIALRKLWLSDPAFNITDGMVEYGEDFTIVTPMLGSIYEVGKGYLTKEDEVDDAEVEDSEDGEDDGESVVAAEDAAPAEETPDDDTPDDDTPGDGTRPDTGEDGTADGDADSELDAVGHAQQAESADKKEPVDS